MGGEEGLEAILADRLRLAALPKGEYGEEVAGEVRRASSENEPVAGRDESMTGRECEEACDG